MADPCEAGHLHEVMGKPGAPLVPLYQCSRCGHLTTRPDARGPADHPEGWQALQDADPPALYSPDGDGPREPTPGEEPPAVTRGERQV